MVSCESAFTFLLLSWSDTNLLTFLRFTDEFDISTLQTVGNNSLNSSEKDYQPSNRTCYVLESHGRSHSHCHIDICPTHHLYKYGLITSNVTDFSWTGHHLFMSTVAIKWAYYNFHETMMYIKSLPLSWDFKEPERTYRMQRRLPGPMKKFNEDQLFFLSYVRVSASLF